MGFQVVQGTPYVTWIPIDRTDQLWVGQIVQAGRLCGLSPVGTSTVFGGNNTFTKPFGVVVGFNDKEPQFSTTYNAPTMTGVTPHVPTRDLVGAESLDARGDRQCFAQVAVIGPDTVIKGNICNGTFGVAPAVGTVSTGNTSGTGFTSTACYDVVPLAQCSTLYCRTGANVGIYRVGNGTSTTVQTNLQPFPNDIAIGDTFCGVPFRPFGNTIVQFDSESMFIDCANNCSAAGWPVRMLRVDLSVAGSEWAMFMFDPISLTSGVAGAAWV